MVDTPIIQHKHYPETLVVMERHTVKERSEIGAALRDLAAAIPEGLIAGPAFCIFWFVTSVQDGFDVQLGFPVSEAFERRSLSTQNYPALEVLSIVHEGSIDELRARYGQLYGYAAEHALISDEFRREIYLDGDNPAGEKIEIQFIIHNWNELLSENVARILGAEAAQTVMRGSQGLGIDAGVAERFAWTKAALERLDSLANEDQKYEIISRCAHVFPQAQIDKQRAAFVEALDESGDSLVAVDAVFDFMAKDPGWGAQAELSTRKSNPATQRGTPRPQTQWKNAKHTASAPWYATTWMRACRRRSAIAAQAGIAANGRAPSASR